MSPFRLFVGIDWGNEEHVACGVSPTGEVLWERPVANTGAGFELLIAALMAACPDPGEVAIGMEASRLPLAEVLVDRAFAVHAINPKQMDRFRDRYSVSGAKDDRRDARVIAQSLRTDLHAFRKVVIGDPIVVQLREVTTVRAQVEEDLRRTTNRLRDALLRTDPDLVKLCPAADEPWLWRLLERAPTREERRKLRPNTVGRILKEHRIRRLNSDDVIAALRVELRLLPGTTAGVAIHVETLLPVLRVLQTQLAAIERQLDATLAAASESAEGQMREHNDVKILLSLPGVGRIVAAVVLARAWPALNARDYDGLRRLSGVAPVTFASGKRSGRGASVRMRRACDGPLRDALFHWAFSSLQADEGSRVYYDRQRAKGAGHARALRALGDRLLRVLIAALRDGTLYDPQRTTPSALPAVA